MNLKDKLINITLFILLTTLINSCKTYKSFQVKSNEEFIKTIMLKSFYGIEQDLFIPIQDSESHTIYKIFIENETLIDFLQKNKNLTYNNSIKELNLYLRKNKTLTVNKEDIDFLKSYIINEDSLKTHTLPIQKGLKTYFNERLVGKYNAYINNQYKYFLIKLYLNRIVVDIHDMSGKDVINKNVKKANNDSLFNHILSSD